ncbi:MAG: hypothetical protein E6J64_02075 [Deltaproteobacteria bacterium]|nr:MAG: hypothetical protein E6J64_02075 [Deltaproteobacteria bacterium]
MTDDAQRVERQLHRLPIFPLPGAVLLPYALIPLHVFEPRYRKMVRDCQAGAGVMALANIPAEPRATRDPPHVLPVIGAGILARVDPLPDGRSNIVLRGVRRARIVEELPTQEPYRLVRAEPLAEPPADAAGLSPTPSERWSSSRRRNGSSCSRRHRRRSACAASRSTSRERSPRCSPARVPCPTDHARDPLRHRARPGARVRRLPRFPGAPLPLEQPALGKLPPDADPAAHARRVHPTPAA